MDILTFFYIVGTIASIGGAIISIQQARNSTNAAKKAKEMRDQFLAFQKSSDLAELQASFRKALKSMEKFGPSTNRASLKGISAFKEAQDVQEFMALLKQDRDFFANGDQNNADSSCEKLSTALMVFAQSQSEDGLLKNGTDLYLILLDISPTIKTLVDAKYKNLS